MTLFYILLIAAFVLGTAAYLIIAYLRSGHPTMAERQRRVAKELRDLERRVR